MSFSSYYIDRGSLCSCCTRKDGSFGSPLNEDSPSRFIDPDKIYRNELTRKFAPFPEDVDRFIDVLVPASEEWGSSCTEFNDAFATWRPKKHRESLMYPFLLDALTEVVSHIPASKRPTFSDCSAQPLPFPFEAFKGNHELSHVSIVASFPGKRLPRFTTRPSWGEFCLIMDVDAEETEDPFLMRCTGHAKRLAKLSKHARNLHLVHGHLASFFVGFYGDVARIACFDEAGAVFSQPFAYRERTDVLRRFFWNFVHPQEGGAIAGCDPMVQRMGPEDVCWAYERVQRIPWTLSRDPPSIEQLMAARRVAVPEHTGSDKNRHFILFEPLYVCAHVFSRATTVWLAIEDVREADHPGRVEEPPKFVVYKEAWRDVEMRSEVEFYERLKASMPTSACVGLPQLVCGADIGGLAEQSAPASEVSLSVSMPRYRTVAGRTSYVGQRSLVCLVVDLVGKSLVKFSSTRELVAAIRDAIEGHYWALKAGILHRDVSVDNIAIMDGEDGRGNGFLHDFDISSMTRDIPVDKNIASVGDKIIEDCGDEIKDRRGTASFIAVGIMLSSDWRSKPIPHVPDHDLQAFYWVLLWFVVHHIHWETPRQCKGPHRCFSYPWDISYNLASLRMEWMCIGQPQLVIPGNDPLTNLLRTFSDRCLENQGPCEGPPQVPFTHEEILKIFDEALERNDWPQGDASIHKDDHTLQKRFPDNYGERRKMKYPRDVDEEDWEAQGSQKRAKTEEPFFASQGSQVTVAWSDDMDPWASD